MEDAVVMLPAKGVRAGTCCIAKLSGIYSSEDSPMRLCRLFLAAMAASALLGAFGSTASAGRLSSSSQTWKTTFPTMTLRLPFGDTVCAMTFEGSFHSRSIAKTVNALIGYITSVAMGPCSSGSKTILTETLPWHMVYAGFTGTLPNISLIKYFLINFSQREREPFGITCLDRSTTEEPVLLNFTREAGGAITTAELGGTVREGAECLGARATVSSARGAVTVAGAATRITVTLI
jgi:hypothetical protein